MKYNININQVAMKEHGISLSQWIILDVLSVASTWSEAIIVNDIVYYWVARQKIAEEIITIGLKPDTIYRHIKKLAELGFIDYVKQGKKDCMRLTKNVTNLFISTMSDLNPNSEMNPNKLGFESENNSDLNPTYNNTNLNNNTTIHYDDFVSLWNEFAKAANKSELLKLSSNRKAKLSKRNSDFKNFTEAFKMALYKANKSTFLKDGSFFSFDWLIANDENIVKVLEDKYQNKEVSYK
jgi:DNA-binding transcriptional ArsR family regulator